MIIRPARNEDAEDACLVLRRSIIELCVADQGNDAKILAGWLANKTPEHVRTWIGNPDNVVVVAEEDGAILGVGAVARSGEITLNYVSPDARFRGVSKAMLARLEVQASAFGQTLCVLTSTSTARRLYEAAGYRADATVKRTGIGTRMRKDLP